MDWKTILGNEWYSLLDDFTDTGEMDKITKLVSLERGRGIVHPTIKEFHKMFRIFKDLQPSDVKVVILGQDPYPDGSGTG